MQKKDWEGIEKKYGAELRALIAKKKITEHQFLHPNIRFGVVSDTHIGSIYEQADVLNFAYDIFARNGIKNVYHCGDITDGTNMRRHHEFEIYAHGVDAQVKTVVKKYPYKKEITTFFCCGNHDYSHYISAGVDIGYLIAQKREDLVYLGQSETDVHLSYGRYAVLMRLFHPNRGGSYALSYAAQKIVESYSGGRKPNILLLGNFHKALYIPCLRNVFTVYAGCIQRQTLWMKEKSIAAHIGFWIVEFGLGREINRFRCEFFAHYER